MIKNNSVRLYYCTVLITVVLSIIVLGFINQVLFFVYGYDLNLLNTTSVASFAAYKSIFGSKLPLLFFIFILTVATFMWTIRLGKKLYKVVYSFGFLILATLMIIHLFAIIFYFIVPHRVF